MNNDVVHDEHTVSTKLALYSHDAGRVLIMHYPRISLYGLPGGHVDANEYPDETIARELMEELAITVNAPKRKDFFLRGDRGTSIILAYTAVAPEAIEVNPTDPDQEIGIWMTRDEVVALPNLSPAYKQFIIENWPQSI